LSPSEQARADAMADAETLRLNAYTSDLCLAAGHGGRCAQRLRFPLGERGGLLGSPEDFAQHHALFAARAAFRAVPGLR
jgi:hypothetical protein